MNDSRRAWIFLAVVLLLSYVYFPVVFVYFTYFTIRKAREYIAALPQSRDLPWWGWALIHGLFLFTFIHFAYKPAYKLGASEYFYATRVFKHIVSLAYLKTPFIFIGLFGPVLAFEWRQLQFPAGAIGFKAPVLMLVVIPNALASADLFMTGMGYSVSAGGGWVFMHSMASIPVTVLVSLSWIYFFENRKRFGF